MSRILFFATGSLPDSKFPNFGGDARVIQISEMLARAGHEVIISEELLKYKVAGKLDLVPPEKQLLSHTLHAKSQIFERVKPDVVYFGSFVTYLEAWVPPVPSIVEMGGPTLLECAFVENVVGPDIYGYFAGELNALAKADLVVLYGERQQWYYRIPLALAGFRLDRPPPIAVVPNAIDAAMILPREMPSEPRFIYAGGIYPWTDPSTAIMTVLDEVDRRKAGEFHLIGGINHHNQVARDRMERISARMATSSRAHCQSFIPFPELVDRLRTMSVSIEIMSANMERDLAQPFRTPLALACGLPLICSDHSENAARIREYDAGWVGPPDDIPWMQRTIAEIYEDPALLRRKSANAQRLARDHFSYEAVVAPLLKFLAAPEIRQGQFRNIVSQDVFTWWSPSEKGLLLKLRHPALRGIRRLLAKILGKS